MVEYKFVLTGPLVGYMYDESVAVRHTLTLYFQTGDGFTPEGSKRVNSLVREELGTRLGNLGESPWGPGFQISRTFQNESDFEMACIEVAEFIEKYRQA